MTVINTNSLSLLTQNNLNKSQASLGAAIESLSSGLRINSAKDDAAGQAIANRMSSSISGQTVAARNANDGISLAQTAEGALSEINNNLQRIRDLTVQAQNGSNSASDIDSIQSEVNQRMEEIDRVTKQTDFNGNKVLNTGAAAAGKTYSFQVGSDDGQTIGITINSSDSWNLAGAGGLADGTYNTKTMATGTAAQAGTNGAAGTAADPGADAVNGVARTVKAEGFDVLHGKVTGGATGTAAGKTPLDDIDAAIKSVDSQRSLLGASENRFDSTISNLNNAVNNLTSARSRIQDADYSTEVSDMSRAQILQQAGTSVLAKANQVPQSVLSLLQG